MGQRVILLKTIHGILRERQIRDGKDERQDEERLIEVNRRKEDECEE